jgi:ABC-type Fe3+-siderophore transport system permease subunit
LPSVIAGMVLGFAVAICVVLVQRRLRAPTLDR